MRNIFWWSAFALIVSGGIGILQAYGQPGSALALTESNGRYPLGLALEYLEDVTGHLTIEDVSQPATQDQFTLSRDDVPNFGFTTSAYWARVRLRNGATGRSQWLLEIGNPFTDRIDIYTPQSNGRWEHRQAGDLLPFHARELAHPNFIVHVPLAPGAEQTIYLRFQNKGRLALNLTLWDVETFALHQRKQQIGIGLFYGAALIMLVYNLLLCGVLRDRMYAHFSLLIASVGLMLLNSDGLAYQYLWPNQPWWNDVSLNTFVGISGIIAISFSDHFLQLRIRRLWLHRIALGTIAVWGLVTLGFFLTRHPVFPQIIVGLNLPAVILLIGAGVSVWRQGYRPARYYLLSWGIFFSGVFLEVLGMVGIIPITLVDGKGIRGGLALALALLSLALADRINLLKQEKADVQAETLRLLQDHERLVEEQNVLLEHNVTERTAELRQSHLTLEQKNAQLHAALASKDKFFAIIAQDLQTPLTGLLELTKFVPEHIGEFSPAEIQEIAGKLRGSLENLHELLKNLFTWSGLQRGTLKAQPQAVDLHTIIGRNLTLFIPAAEHKQVMLRSQVEPETMVYADPDMVYAIFRNLISNAIKFTFPGDKVTITAIHQDHMIEVAIADTGVGISPENLGKLFREDVTFQTPGTEGEEGTGLGLLLCKSLVERLGGGIWGESEEDAGTTFHFTMPISGNHLG